MEHNTGYIPLRCVTILSVVTNTGENDAMTNMKLAERIAGCSYPKYSIGNIVTTVEPCNGPMRITDMRPTMDGSWLYSVDAIGEGMDSEYRQGELTQWVDTLISVPADDWCIA